MKTCYAYVIADRSTYFGFTTAAKALDDLFESSGYITDDVEIYTYETKNPGNYTEEDAATRRLIVGKKEMKSLFTELKRERNRLAKKIIEKKS